MKIPMVIGYLILILIVGDLTTSSARADHSNEAIVVPTEMCEDYFFIPITLAPRDGYPQNRTLWFLYDTGASISIVDPSSLKKVSGAEIKSGKWVNIRDASAGPIKFNKLKAKAQNLDHLSMAMGRQIDGILSFSSFRKFLLTLDYMKDEIRLERGELPNVDGIKIFSSKGKDSRPWLTMEFSNRKRSMLIDSGAARSGLIVRDLDRFETTMKPVTYGASFRLKEIEIRSAARAEGNVRFGPYVLNTPTLKSTSGTELIGGEILHHFSWTFDQKNDRVRIVQNNPEMPITFESVIAHGMVLSPNSAGFKVKTILKGTPAASAGIKPEDLITHFNGVPYDRHGCEEKSKANEILTVTLQRNGVALEVDLFLFPLVD